MTNILIMVAVIVVYLLIQKFTAPKVEHISVDQLKVYLKDQTITRQFVDVRTPQEFSNRKIKGFKNYPLQSLAIQANSLNKETPVVLMCASGMRSMKAASLLSKMGYKNILNVKGGISGYQG